MSLNTAADTNCTAAALIEYLAAFVSFQWQQGMLTPTRNVNSAISPLLAACHFSGNYAICATNAVTIATFVAYRRYDEASIVGQLRAETIPWWLTRFPNVKGNIADGNFIFVPIKRTNTEQVVIHCRHRRRRFFFAAAVLSLLASLKWPATAPKMTVFGKLGGGNPSAKIANFANIKIGLSWQKAFLMN